MARNTTVEKLIQKHIQEALQKALPLKTDEDFIKFYNTWAPYPHNITYGTKWEIVVEVYEGDWISTTHVRFFLSGPGITFISFALSNYPACCGITMFHHFMTSCKEQNQELFKVIFKAMLDGCCIYNDIKANTGRIETVMVSYNPALKGDPMLTAQEAAADVPIKYGQFHKYWHAHARKVNTRLMYNKNSGNLLHNMEIIL